MSLQLVLNALVALVVIGVIGSRQLRWRGLDRSSVWRAPMILGIAGLASLWQQAQHLTIGGLDAALIGVELAVAVGTGLAMGRITVVRRAAQPDSKGRTLESRTGWVGMALWVALIAVRVGLDAFGAAMGVHLLTATGVILLTVAANRAASALVLDSRLPQTATVKA